MATSKERFKKIADEIGRTADSFVLEVKAQEDKLREQGRDVDDKIHEWADENATAIADKLGTDPGKTGEWLPAVIYVTGIASVIIAVVLVVEFFLK